MEQDKGGYGGYRVNDPHLQQEGISLAPLNRSNNPFQKSFEPLSNDISSFEEPADGKAARGGELHPDTRLQALRDSSIQEDEPNRSAHHNPYGQQQQPYARAAVESPDFKVTTVSKKKGNNPQQQLYGVGPGHERSKQSAANDLDSYQRSPRERVQEDSADGQPINIQFHPTQHDGRQATDPTVH